MKLSSITTTFATFAGLGHAQIVARQQGKLPPVTVRGNAFFAGNDRFYIRGVAYQPGKITMPMLQNVRNKSYRRSCRCG
jgi:1,3-beta-glucanosyltransferase GAS5